MITTLTGANSFGLKQALAENITRFLADHDAMGLERIDGEEAEFDRISESLNSLPFLATKKLVVLHSGSVNKRFAEQAKKLLSQLPETTDLIIVEPKLDKRSAYYKYLKRATDYKEFNELDVNGLSRWAADRATAAGGNLNSSDARFLIERVGLNQQLIAHEIDKLLLNNATITRASIEMLTEAAPQSTIFELLEAAFAGNMKRAIALYQEQRTLKVEPQQIIAMLGWQLHIVALVKTAGSRNSDQIAKEAKISPYVAKKSAAIARSIGLSELKKLISDLLTIDARLKRESLDADEVLQTYLLKLAS